MRTDERGRFSNFAGGSLALLDAAVEAQKNGSTVIVGGGDTGESGQSFLYIELNLKLKRIPVVHAPSATLVAQQNAEDKLAHVSTGGGARSVSRAQIFHFIVQLAN